MTGLATVIAALTEQHHGGLVAMTDHLALLDPAETSAALVAAINLLYRETTIGCADAGMTVDEYLGLLGLANARSET